MFLSCLAALLLLPAASPQNGAAVSAAATTPSSTLTSAQRRAVIPFELGENGIYFQLKIAGTSKTLWFSLDTGSAATYLDTGVAKELGLRTAGSGTVHGAGAGTIPVSYLDGVTFELPGLRSADYRVNTTDLSGVQEGHPMQGFLGNDFIGRYVITLDYVKHEMTIEEPASFVYRGHGEAIPIEMQHRWPYLEGMVAVAGQTPVAAKFVVDSGSGDAVADPAILHTTAPVKKTRTGVGLGQPVEGVIGRATYFQLGTYRLLDPVVTCCSGNEADLHKIGTEILKRFTVTLDYTRQRMIFEPNSNFAKSFPGPTF